MKGLKTVRQKMCVVYPYPKNFLLLRPIEPRLLDLLFCMSAVLQSRFAVMVLCLRCDILRSEGLLLDHGSRCAVLTENLLESRLEHGQL